MPLQALHYHIMQSDLDAFKAEAVSVGLEDRLIVVLEPGQSHVDPDAQVMVWNHGTPEWTDEIDRLFEECDWSSSLSKLALLSQSKRGNRQVNYGCPSRCYKIVQDTASSLNGISIPDTFVGTEEAAPLFLQYSQLFGSTGYLCSSLSSLGDDHDRTSLFAEGLIIEGNRFEGMTNAAVFSLHPDWVDCRQELIANPEIQSLASQCPAVTDMMKPSAQPDFTTSHLDTKNCPEMQDVWLAMKTFELEYQPANEATPPFRVVASMRSILFHKASCFHSMKKIAWQEPIVRHVSLAYGKLSEERKSIPKLIAYLQNLLMTSSSPRLDQWMVLSCHADKNVFYSTLSNAIVSVFTKHPSHVVRWIELSAFINNVTSAHHFYEVCDHLVSLPVLPDTNLWLYCLLYCRREYGGSCGGLYCRLMPHFNDDTVSEYTIACGCSLLLSIIEEFQDEPVFRCQKKAARLYNQTVKRLQTSSFVPGAGSLTAQHWINVVILLGIIPHPILATQAHIASSTKSFDRCASILVNAGVFDQAVDAQCFLKDPENQSKLLGSTAHALGLTKSGAEQVICKATAPNPRPDYFRPNDPIRFIGQELGPSGRCTGSYCVMQAAVDSPVPCLVDPVPLQDNFPGDCPSRPWWYRLVDRTFDVASLEESLSTRVHNINTLGVGKFQSLNYEEMVSYLCHEQSSIDTARVMLPKLKPSQRDLQQAVTNEVCRYFAVPTNFLHEVPSPKFPPRRNGKCRVSQSPTTTSKQDTLCPLGRKVPYGKPNVSKENWTSSTKLSNVDYDRAIRELKIVPTQWSARPAPIEKKASGCRRKVATSNEFNADIKKRKHPQSRPVVVKFTPPSPSELRSVYHYGRSSRMAADIDDGWVPRSSRRRRMPLAALPINSGNSLVACPTVNVDQILVNERPHLTLRLIEEVRKIVMGDDTVSVYHGPEKDSFLKVVQFPTIDGKCTRWSPYYAVIEYSGVIQDFSINGDRLYEKRIYRPKEGYFGKVPDPSLGKGAFRHLYKTKLDAKNAVLLQLLLYGDSFSTERCGGNYAREVFVQKTLLKTDANFVSFRLPGRRETNVPFMTLFRSQANVIHALFMCANGKGDILLDMAIPFLC